jgi:hypothetical protein
VHKPRSTVGAHLRSTTDLAAIDEPEALQRHLIESSYEHAEFNCFDAVVAFRHAHRIERDDAHLTALLLCTDRRWRRTTKPLIKAIVAAAILSDDALDTLAGWFLAGEDLWIHVPASMVDGRSAGSQSTIPLWREVAPPLVGWAAGHTARRGGASAAEILLASLDDRSGAYGAAVLKGLIEVLDALPEVFVQRILDRALSWPEAATRIAAIRHLHAHGHVDRAIRLARADAAGSIRRLGDRLDGQLPPGSDLDTSPAGVSGRPAGSMTHPTLFPL